MGFIRGSTPTRSWAPVLHPRVPHRKHAARSLQDRSRQFAVRSGRWATPEIRVLTLAFAEALAACFRGPLSPHPRSYARCFYRCGGSLSVPFVVSPAVAISGLCFARSALAFIGAALPASSLSRMQVAFALGKR